jgi:prevent-host-death family protein
VRSATVGPMDAPIQTTKAKLSELIRKVQRGEDVVITQRGEPVARLVPYHQEDEDQ